MHPSEALQRIKEKQFFAEGSLSEAQINADLDDLFRCLESINGEVNGSVPSLSSGRRNTSLLVDVGYWLAQILSDGQMTLLRLRADSSSEVERFDQLLVALWKVGHAWAQVIAGDIDDLAEDTELEFDARRLA